MFLQRGKTVGCKSFQVHVRIRISHRSRIAEGQMEYIQTQVSGDESYTLRTGEVPVRSYPHKMEDYATGNRVVPREFIPVPCIMQGAFFFA